MFGKPISTSQMRGHASPAACTSIKYVMAIPTLSIKKKKKVRICTYFSLLQKPEDQITHRTDEGFLHGFPPFLL
jgi:hypothetical protein